MIEGTSQRYKAADNAVLRQYEQLVFGKGSREDSLRVRSERDRVQAELGDAMKKSYEKRYHVFCLLLKASRMEIPLSKVLECIKQIVVDVDGRIVVEWRYDKLL